MSRSSRSEMIIVPNYSLHPEVSEPHDSSSSHGAWYGILCTISSGKLDGITVRSTEAQLNTNKEASFSFARNGECGRADRILYNLRNMTNEQRIIP